MKLTINTDPNENPFESPGMEAGLDSINAWLALKQIDPAYMQKGSNSFGMQMTDGTRLLFILDAQGGRVTLTPPGKGK